MDQGWALIALTSVPLQDLILGECRRELGLGLSQAPESLVATDFPFQKNQTCRRSWRLWGREGAEDLDGKV